MYYIYLLNIIFEHTKFNFKQLLFSHLIPYVVFYVFTEKCTPNLVEFHQFPDLPEKSTLFIEICKPGFQLNLTGKLNRIYF